jgi:hypothetical protein
MSSGRLRSGFRRQRGSQCLRRDGHTLVRGLVRDVIRRNRSGAVERPDFSREIKQRSTVEAAADQAGGLRGAEAEIFDPTTPARVGHPPSIVRHFPGKCCQRSIELFELHPAGIEVDGYVGRLGRTLLLVVAPAAESGLNAVEQPHQFATSRHDNGEVNDAWPPVAED